MKNIRLEVYPMTTKLVGRKEDLTKYADLISEDIDIPVDNYQFSFSYQNFGEIPVNHFYDKKTNTFPTGLLESVKGLLKANNLEYEVVDKRPKGLFTSDDLLTSPITLGGRTTEGKYAYQMDAINSIIKSNGKGILNLSVGSGKCLPVDTYLLTDTGYKTIRDILNNEGLEESSNESIHTAKNTILVNRYGENEKVDKITINGIKPINKVILNSGIYEEMTPNHPLLEFRPSADGFVWVKSSDIKVGDIIVTRDHCRNFGTFKEDNKETILKSDKIKEKYNLSTAYDLVFDEVSSIEFVGYQRTYDVSMPKTHSFIANGIVNHNTLLFSALAKIALPHLNDGEHILFFTSSKEIFKQTLKELEDMTGQEIGYYASKKYKDRPIMVVMLQSAYALYKIDPYKGLKLTPKDRELRKIKDVILPKISNGNSINALKAYLRFMKLDTKVAKNFKEMLENEIDTSGSDKELVDKLTAYANEFDERIEDKAKDSKEKKDFIVNLLNSAVFICNDECQHLTAESYYKVILACKNALVCVGLSGSLDPKNKLLQQRVKAIFEKITYRVKLVDNVKRGVSVKPIIHMLSVNSPKNIASLREWPEVYATGIVHNEYRNNLIAKLVAEKAYPSGRVTLIIVNQIDHGKDLLKRLTDLGVPAVFIYGQSEDEYRRKSIQAMRDNKVKVAIATSILDEGVDVKTIKVLILAAAGKSYRTTIQRIGRSVRLGEFNDAHIFDFFDNQNYMLSRQSLERMNIYKEQQLEIKENK
ncbi:helicase [Lactobacillus phage SAC12B]|uniref:Helicase n=1 Tax=Lactobacillus phage SAC12B TaxID=2510941 RepID=A0A4Y5FHD1_9CAUD|nr:helicase [Lactobacillus phage SAC12B]QBJ03938.1 helicase [Lactobacillus phage SAC12B]